ncbi:MAG: iron ABC transporter ATP-binding protein, partial [Propionibacterium sp.]
IISAPMMLLVTFGGGVWLVNTGYVEVSQVIAVSLIALILPHAVEALGEQTWGQQMAQAAAVRIKNIIDCQHLEYPTTSEATPQGHNVSFENVSFSYGEVQALKNVSLELPAGSVTALVGPSGSGKSTLATLVARFHDPASGTVRIGGVDIRKLSETDLYQQVSFVLQNPQLLNISIAENIALAKPKASKEDIISAAKSAQIHDDIMALPKGYDTILGSDTKLSGGQEQRIAIARAILANRPILLLDEATAMTDPDCEAEIQKALTNLVADKTVLVIAHRPNSVRGADQIVVLVAGEIAAVGSHDELINEPHYQSIWHSTKADTRKVAK